MLTWWLPGCIKISQCICYFRILTGSFDKTVKIWTADGKPIHKLDNFLSTISGICYVPRSKTVWVAAGTSYAVLYDPKSGDNVSSLFDLGTMLVHC